MKFILVAVVFVLLPIVDTGTSAAQVLSEGYCGRDAAQACVRDLGIGWRSTSATDKLETSPYASFRELADAVESLGLHVLMVSVDRTNVSAFRALLLVNSGQASGVAWLSPDGSKGDSSEGEHGHFVVATSITDDEKVVYYDSQTNIVRHIVIEGDDQLPLLIVSKLPLKRTSTYSSIVYLANSAISSPYATVSLLLFGFMMLVQVSPERQLVRLSVVGATSLVLLLVMVSFQILPSIGRTLSSDPKHKNVGLAFTSRVYDAGAMHVNSGDTVDVTLVNGTEHHLEVEEIIGSCGCMDIKPDHASLDPGEAVVCSVQFSTIKFGKSDYIITAVSGGEAVRCTITLEGDRGVALLPRRKVVGQLDSNGGGVLFHELKITNYRGPPLDGVALVNRSRNSKLQFDLLPNGTFADDRSLSIRVRVAEDVDIRGLHFETLLIKAGTGDKAVSCLVDVGVEFTGTSKVNGG